MWRAAKNVFVPPAAASSLPILAPAGATGVPQWTTCGLQVEPARKIRLISVRCPGPSPGASSSCQWNVLAPTRVRVSHE